MPSPCVIETTDGPPAYLGGLLPATTPLQRLWHAAARRLTRGFKRTLHLCYRRQMRACGLPAIYRSDRSEAVYSPQCILALGVPSFELAQHWPAAVRFVGPQLCTPPSSVTAPTFVDGRRPVLVTLGTHLQWVKQRMDGVLRALAPQFPEVVFHFSDGDTGAPPQPGQGNYQRLPICGLRPAPAPLRIGDPSRRCRYSLRLPCRGIAGNRLPAGLRPVRPRRTPAGCRRCLVVARSGWLAGVAASGARRQRTTTRRASPAGGVTPDPIAGAHRATGGGFRADRRSAAGVMQHARRRVR